MRVAVFVVSILVVATSSYASDSCMTKGEARSHFATSYLYWHGPGHCWDANSGRRQLIRNQQKSNEVVRKEDREPKWLEAHSQLLSSNEAPSAPTSQPSKTYETSHETAVGGPWSDRWVDITHPAPPTLDARPSDTSPSLRTSARSSVPGITAGGIILIFLGSIVMVAVIEFGRRSANV
jgi:hypothetical protein